MPPPAAKPHGPEGVIRTVEPSAHVQALLTRLRSQYTNARARHLCHVAATDSAVASIRPHTSTTPSHLVSSHIGDGPLASSLCHCTNTSVATHSHQPTHSTSSAHSSQHHHTHIIHSATNSTQPHPLPSDRNSPCSDSSDSITDLRKEMHNLDDCDKLSLCRSKMMANYNRSKTIELHNNVLNIFQRQYLRLDCTASNIDPSSPPPPHSAHPNPKLLGCSHYARNCKIKAKCCGIFVSCRFCHDEAMADDHEMDRFSTDTVLCMFCLTEQPMSPACTQCHVSFAHYYCSHCRFFENTPNKKVYHCLQCNICRLGEGLGIDNYHCHKCDSCVRLKSRDRHRCRKNSLRSNCPICTGYLFTSREPVVFMRCGHTMHSRCFDDYTSRSYQCPLCMRSLTDMSTFFQQIDELVASDPMPPEYASKRSHIFCNDCTRKSIVPYNFVYHKCTNGDCGSYNTKVLDVFDSADHKNNDDDDATNNNPTGSTGRPTSSLDESGTAAQDEMETVTDVSPSECSDTPSPGSAGHSVHAYFPGGMAIPHSTCPEDAGDEMGAVEDGQMILSPLESTV